MHLILHFTNPLRPIVVSRQEPNKPYCMTNIKLSKQSMQTLFIGTNPKCCIFVEVRVLAEQGVWRDTAFPAIYYRLFLRL